LPSAASTEGALDASIGLSGCPTSSPNSDSASAPPSSAASATAGSDPRSITARRTSAAGTPAARATASVITPSSAPWRSSPESSRTRKYCSSAVAAPMTASTSRFRSATEPGPTNAPISLKDASTPGTVSDGAAEGGGADRSAAHPTPICRCGSSPERYATTIGTSSGPADWSADAIAAILANRPDDPATARDTSATSASSTPTIVARPATPALAPPPARLSRCRQGVEAPTAS